MVKSNNLFGFLIVLFCILTSTTKTFSKDNSPITSTEKTSKIKLQNDVIEYTLTDADYALVGNGFSNFDIREGYDEETVMVRLAKISKILLNNFPDYKKGQKLAVSYNVWKPGDDVFVMNVEFNGTKYVLQKK